jgi:2-succinyl-5-enolpyruvyl-6-hydroxy-3-cyclohexene-1-carboxylate synthase
MHHQKQHITDLSEICYQCGIKYIVISPGSRNAPLIEAFYSRYKDRCISIVDERSAAYFALGLARYLDYPVALVCTSGTAVLNYGPALAEAYYANVPLIAITADRPAEWIDQQDNQTIRQNDVYRNFISKSYCLPEIIDNNDGLKLLWQTVQQAIKDSYSQTKGPVHINIPLREPLYDELPPVSADIEYIPYNSKSTNQIPDELISDFRQSEKIMIIHGLDACGEFIAESFNCLSDDQSVILIAENISNISVDGTIPNPELLLSLNSSEKLYAPDLVIYSGGQVTSKRLKNYLRTFKNLKVWRIGLDAYPMDTFKQNNRILKMKASDAYHALTKLKPPREKNGFKLSWHKAYSQMVSLREKIVEQLPFSDLLAIHTIIKALPQEINLELGNSTPIRYTQFLALSKGIKYFCNRGVSGIDGCLSSAVGTAFASGKLTFLIAGDLTFIYDSNALWNKRLPQNLRIVVMNNHGGGIFSLLNGPKSKASFNDYVETSHPVNIQKLVEAFNLDYFCIKDEESLSKTFPVFLKNSGKAKVLEIITERDKNSMAFDLITGRLTLKNNIE